MFQMWFDLASEGRDRSQSISEYFCFVVLSFLWESRQTNRVLRVKYYTASLTQDTNDF